MIGEKAIKGEYLIPENNPTLILSQLREVRTGISPENYYANLYVYLIFLLHLTIRQLETVETGFKNNKYSFSIDLIIGTNMFKSSMKP